MAIDDQIRTIEDKLTALEKERSRLLGELKSLRVAQDESSSVVKLGRPTLMRSPESNEEKTDL
ncbi:MAG: hypothetical protein KDD38_02815, partial [Bdellovibrionales bacterium]|nr:hypothetical protein [Bdellovibrionales bacterium]